MYLLKATGSRPKTCRDDDYAGQQWFEGILMKINKMAFLLCASSISSVNAASFSIAFPSFDGTYIYPNGVVKERFDLGSRLASIQSAELLFEASGTPGLLQICYSASCTTTSFGQDLIWGFGYEPGHEVVYGVQDLTNSVKSYIQDITHISSFLLDGAGEVYIEPNLLFFIPEAQVTILRPSTYQISNVVLNVEGTQVPVPPAAVLFLLGLAGLVGLYSISRTRSRCNRNLIRG